MDQTVPAYAAEVADYGRSRDPEPGEGALVKNVRPESPAWDVGIEPGMRVLTVNGEQLTDMIVWLWEADDDTVDLEVLDPRDNTVTPVELDRFPGEDWGLEFDGPIFDGMRTCVNACVFCFMTMLPKGGRSTLYIRDDDYRLSFLQGNFVTLTNLSDEDVQNVIDRNMSPMNVSVHAVSPDVRRRMMGRNAQRGMDVLEAIMAAGIEIHAQIVLCPGMNDGEELEKTLRFCEEHEQITSLGIVPLGFTKHQNRFSWSYSDKPELARETIAMIRPFQDRAYERFGRHTFQMSDEFYLDAGIEPPEADFYDGYPQYYDGIGMIRSYLDETDDVLAVDAERLRRVREAIAARDQRRLGRIEAARLRTLAEILRRRSRAERRKHDAPPVVPLCAADVHAQRGIFTRRKREGVVDPRFKFLRAQKRLRTIGAVLRVQHPLRRLLDLGKMRGQNTSRLRGIAALRRQRSRAPQNRIADTQLLRLIRIGIGICHNVQPHGLFRKRALLQKQLHREQAEGHQHHEQQQDHK